MAEFTPITHDIWNAVDEYGLKLSIERLPGEQNIQYLERMRTLMTRVYGQSKQGILNALSSLLNLETYSIHDTAIYTLNYTPALKSEGVDMYASLDGLPLTQVFEDTFDSAADDTFIVWKEYDGSYGTRFQLKKVTAGELKVRYYTIVNDELHEIEDTFTVEEAQKPNSNQIEIIELNNPEDLDAYKKPNGTFTEEYLAFVDDINTRFERYWGSFKWDSFYWDEGTKLNTIESHYDSSAPGSEDLYGSGVGDGDDLKIMGITKDKNLVIHPGYYYIKGSEHYLYSAHQDQIIDPADHGGLLPDSIPLEMKDENDQTISAFPVYGRPVIVCKSSALPIMQVGPSGDTISYSLDNKDTWIKNLEIWDNATYQYPHLDIPVERETEVTNGHTHKWMYYHNIKDTWNQNGRTDVIDGHYHEIVAGIVLETEGHTHVISNSIDIVNQTPNVLRKRLTAPDEIEVPDDAEYFTMIAKPELVSIHIEGDVSKYNIMYDTDEDFRILSGLEAPIMDANLFALSGTFLGLGQSAPIKMNSTGVVDGILCTTSYPSIKQGKPFGITAEVLDANNGRIAGADVIIEAPAGTQLHPVISSSVSGEVLNKVHLGHTYNDGTLYGRIAIASTDVAAGSDIALTVRVNITIDKNWTLLPNMNVHLLSSDIGLYTYTWTTLISIRYDGV